MLYVPTNIFSRYFLIGNPGFTRSPVAVEVCIDHTSTRSGLCFMA